MIEEKKDLWDYLALIVMGIFIGLCVSFCTSTAKAQNVVRKGDTFVQVSSKKHKGDSILTKHTYVDSDGKKYPIYLSSNGKAFIYRKSKTGKRYKMYLPQITKQIAESYGFK